MISALGHCEDEVCSQSTNNCELVRLFRCSIHCDRLLCLHHLNAHNILYEEEKKQNNVVLNELQNCLTIYQTIFEQHLQEYRQLVHQASTLLLHNTSTIIPIEQIRPVLEKLQRTIAMFRQEKVVIKNETILDAAEFDIDSHFLKDISSIKTEISNTPKKMPLESNQVIVRVERIDYGTMPESIPSKDPPIDCSDTLDENQQKRSRRNSPVKPTKKKNERTKKKSDKTIPLKRLQT